MLSVALFVTATFLATPYAFNYDMVVFGWVIALLHEQGGEPLDDRLAMAMWTLPITAMLLGLFGIPGSAAVLAAFRGPAAVGGSKPATPRARPVGRTRRGPGLRDLPVLFPRLDPVAHGAEARVFLAPGIGAGDADHAYECAGTNRTHCTSLMGVSVLAFFASAWSSGSACCRRRAAACRR